jgi:hypothetical protein
METIVAHAKEQDAKIQDVSDRARLTKSQPQLASSD